MAVTPLFIASMDVLKARLRLSGAAQIDALAMIDAAVEKVRWSIYDALGMSRTNEILTYGYSENPSTENGLARTKANSLELAWVKLELLRSMPVLFMDAEGAKREAWNEEGLTRRASQKDLKDEMDRLVEEIASALQSLESGEAVSGGIQVSVIGPDEVPDRPGASIKPLVFS